jgi:predicted PurR-regulated permease PerM
MDSSRHPKKNKGPKPSGPPGASIPATGADNADLLRGLSILALSLLILTLTYLILRELSTILQPLFIAVFMCYLIVPSHRWLVRHKIPSGLSYLCIVAFVVFLINALGTMVFRSVDELTQNKDVYQERLEETMQGLIERFRTSAIFPFAEDDPTTATATVAPTPVETPDDAALPSEVAGSPRTPTIWRDFTAALRGALSFERILGLAQSTLGTFIGYSTVVVIVIFYLIFLLAELANLDRRLENAFGKERARRMLDVFVTINGAIAQYLGVKTLVSFIVGGLTTIILFVFGVDYALMWGILTFFANFIPYVGSIVAIMLPIGMALVQFDSLWAVLTVAALLLGAQQLTGNWLEPKMMGKRLGLSPLMILVGLAFWGSLWGVVGMVLSIPMLVSLRIVLENIDETRPLAKLISDV